MISKTGFVALMFASSLYDGLVRHYGGENYLRLLAYAFVIAIVVVKMHEDKEEERGEPMGMDARTVIWVGYDWEEIAELISEEVAEDLSADGGIEIGNLTVREFVVNEARVGIGIELLRHDLDSDIKPIDLVDLAGQAATLKARLTDAFRTWDIDLEPKVFLASDFS